MFGLYQISLWWVAKEKLAESMENFYIPLKNNNSWGHLEPFWFGIVDCRTKV